MINRLVRLYACNGFAGTDWRATLGGDWRATFGAATTEPVPAAQMLAPTATERLRDVSQVPDVSQVSDVSALGASARHDQVSAHAFALPIPP